MTADIFLTLVVLFFLAIGIAAYWSKLGRDNEALKARGPRDAGVAESAPSDMSGADPDESTLSPAEPAEPRSGPVITPAVVTFVIAVAAVTGSVLTRSTELGVVAGVLVGLWWLVLVVQTWWRVRAQLLRQAALAEEAHAAAPLARQARSDLSAEPAGAPAPVAEVQTMRAEVAHIAARVQEAPEQAAPDIAPEIALLRQEIAALSARTEQSDAARVRQMQPELTSLRGEIADLATMIARAQPESPSSRTDLSPDIDALRKELTALAAQVQAAASAPPPPQAAAPAVRIEKGPWLLRPLPAGLIAACLIAITYISAAGPEFRGKFIRIGDEPRVAAPVSVAPVSVAPVAAVAPVAPPSVPSKPDTRIALVIGNGAYKTVPKLANPTRDADAIVASLKSIGFQSVTRHVDLGREKMNDVLRSFAAEAENADWAVVYFAGHGIEIGGVNYLIPVDARLGSDNVVPLEAVSLDNVMTAVAGARRLRLVLLDACRDNPFVNQMKRSLASRSIGRGLGRVEPDAGTLVVFAAKHGEVALDGAGQNSPFAASFARRIMTPGLEVRRLFDHVRDDVLETTGRKQQPFSYGSLPGREDFFFIAGK